MTNNLLITVAVAAVAALSAVRKLRRDPKIVHIVNEVVGVPLAYFPYLAICLFAGALGLIAGIWWAPIGIAAGIGLVIYFLGAIVAHVRVRDLKGVAPAVVILILCVAALALRFANH